MLEIAEQLFKGYGKFLLFLMLALIMPEITHQHLNYSSFEYEIRLLSRYGFLAIGLGVLIKDVLGADIQ